MKKGFKRKFISEPILASETEVGKVYVTQGGITRTRDGEVHVWGFDRVRVQEIKPTYVKVEVPWKTTVDLQPDYILFTTTEKELKMTMITHLVNRDKTTTELLTFAEAIERKLETMQDEKKKKKTGTLVSQLEPIVIKRLSSPEGVSFSELAAECGTRSQFVRYIAYQLEKKGYTLINVNGPIYQLIKQ